MQILSEVNGHEKLSEKSSNHNCNPEQSFCNGKLNHRGK